MVTVGGLERCPLRGGFAVGGAGSGGGLWLGGGGCRGSGRFGFGAWVRLVETLVESGGKRRSRRLPVLEELVAGDVDCVALRVC